jgi:hypothetical protein
VNRIVIKLRRISVRLRKQRQVMVIGKCIGGGVPISENVYRVLRGRSSGRWYDCKDGLELLATL